MKTVFFVPITGFVDVSIPWVDGSLVFLVLFGERYGVSMPGMKMLWCSWFSLVTDLMFLPVGSKFLKLILLIFLISDIFVCLW